MSNDVNSSTLFPDTVGTTDFSFSKSSETPASSSSDLFDIVMDFGRGLFRQKLLVALDTGLVRITLPMIRFWMTVVDWTEVIFWYSNRSKLVSSHDSWVWIYIHTIERRVFISLFLLLLFSFGKIVGFFFLFSSSPLSYRPFSLYRGAHNWIKKCVKCAKLKRYYIPRDWLSP